MNIHTTHDRRGQSQCTKNTHIKYAEWQKREYSTVVACITVHKPMKILFEATCDILADVDKTKHGYSFSKRRFTHP